MAVGVAVIAASAVSCSKSEEPSDVAAVLQDTGQFGAIMVNTQGEMFLPMVARDAAGSAVGISGIQWLSATGPSAAVFIDERGLPTSAVMGDFIVLYANWNTATETVDLAKIYTAGDYIEIFKGVSVPGSGGLAAKTNPQAPGPGRGPGTRGVFATCFPACESDEKNLTELLKITALSIEVGLCGVGASISFGAALIPCAGLIVSTAAITVGDEKWLEDHASLHWGLKASGCAKEQAPACIAALLDFVGEVAGHEHMVIDDHAALVATARGALDDPNQGSGVVAPGSGLPACAETYECTPGAYMPCYPDGVKQCGESCAWGECPRFEPGCGQPPGGCVAGQAASAFGDGCCITDGACTAGGTFSACSNLCNGWYEYQGALYGPCSTGYNGGGGGMMNPAFGACIEGAAAALNSACNPPPP